MGWQVQAPGVPHSTHTCTTSIRIESPTISGQAQHAALDELYGLGYDYDKTFDARINAVTRDDVVRVARKYLNNHVLVTTSPDAEPK